MQPTAEQQKAIDTTDRTLLLSAAAGSGKTATLTERLIRMITRKEDPLDVSRMLIATFTRAAAEELRVRIASALADATAKDPDNEWLTRQTLLFPAARIRTIDGFCNDIVKGHTEELGISPLYRIANESESDLLGIRLMTEVIDDAYSGTYAPEGLDMISLVESVENIRDGGSLAESLYRLYKNDICHQPEGVDILRRHADTLLSEREMPFFHTRCGKVLAAHYKELFTHKKDTLRGALDTLIEKLGATAPSVLALRDKAMSLLLFYTQMADAADTSYGALRACAASYAPIAAKSFPKGYEAAEEEIFFKDLLKELSEEANEFKKGEHFPWKEEDLPLAFSASAEICRSVHFLLLEFDLRFCAEKKRLSLCDYADIERYAYRLLWDDAGERTPLSRELAASFDTVCIDEYQDVNAMQHKIFEGLCTPRNRFMVGDIKQSIYGFRGAEPDIFARLRASFPPLSANKDEAVLFLTQNFRSERSVIDLANGVFDFLFPLIAKSIGYVPEDRLRTEREPSSTPLPVFYLMPNVKEGGTDEDDALPPKTENERIAEKVLALLAHGTLADGKRICPSDIAILSHGGKSMRKLIETLRAYGIPLQTEDKEDFFSRREILLALCLCHTVNNPHNDLYLAGLLRSPLYGFTMSDLIRMREAAPSGATLFDGLRKMLAQDPSFEKGARFLGDLSRFRAMAENAPAHRLIRTLFEETGIYATTDAEGRASLRIFYELARTYEEGAFRGLYRFLQRITDMEEFGASLDKRTVGSKNAVNVLTIHKSKGLEFPVCILAHTCDDLGGGGHTPMFRFDPSLGLFSDIQDPSGLATVKTPLSFAAALAAQRRETEEAIRVLYVALTRPKEQLYLFGCPQRKHLSTVKKDAALLELSPSFAALLETHSFAAWILAALANVPSLCRIEELPPRGPFIGEDPPVSPQEPAAKDASEEKSTIAQKELLSLTAQYRERFSFRYPYEAQTLLPAKLSVSSLHPGVLDELAERSPFDEEHPLLAEITRHEAEEEKDTFSPTLPTFLSGKEENEAAKAGTATHLFLQFCDFNVILQTDGYQTKEDLVQAELKRLLAQGFMTPADGERVRIHELAAFFTSTLADILCRARKTHREFRFHAKLPASSFTKDKSGRYDGLFVFVQGVIDLLVECEDGSLLLLDYKTDRIPRELLGDTEGERSFLWDRHGMQLSLYAQVAERIFGKAPALAIYSLHAKKLLFRPEK